MPGKRGRAPGFTMTADHRAKIQNSNILNALIEHVEGRREMLSTQVTAAIALLRKVMPDLAVTEITGEVEHTYVARMPNKAVSTDQWLNESRSLSGSPKSGPSQH